jgi:hypothetical protein
LLDDIDMTMMQDITGHSNIDIWHGSSSSKK